MHKYSGRTLCVNGNYTLTINSLKIIKKQTPNLATQTNPIGWEKKLHAYTQPCILLNNGKKKSIHSHPIGPLNFSQTHLNLLHINY